MESNCFFVKSKFFENVDEMKLSICMFGGYLFKKGVSDVLVSYL